MRISLLQWIQSGKFGPLQIGDSRQKVLETFGEPPNWMTEPIPKSPIWKYGDIEFYFQNDILWMILLDDFRFSRGEAGLQIAPDFINGDVTPAQAAKYLAQNGVSFRSEIFPYNDNGLRCVCDSGATFSFAGDFPDKVRLHSFWLKKM